MANDLSFQHLKEVIEKISGALAVFVALRGAFALLLKATPNKKEIAMGGTLGTKNIKEALMLVADVAFVLKDGKVNAEDMASFIQLAADIGPALEGMDQIPLEAKELDSEDITEIVNAVTTKLAVTDSKAMAIIGHGLKIVAAAFEIYKLAKPAAPAA